MIEILDGINKQEISFVENNKHLHRLQLFPWGFEKKNFQYFDCKVFNLGL